ncbi:MAG: hypothetical protein BGO29_02290 [Bacteroidales bacterium 36-12]|nr:MAG: hypothetical protein BGO29_02290 [Bacteroidales bacterium 36-12]
MNQELEIIDRFIESDGSVSVSHNEFGLCVLINLKPISQMGVILDTNGYEHSISLSDIELVD